MGHSKSILTFLIEVLLVTTGISLIQVHLVLSCVAILLVMAFNIVKFIYWYKNRVKLKDEG